MRERRRISYLVGILSLLLAVAGLCGCNSGDGTALADDNDKNVHWTQNHIRKVPPIMMYEPFFSVLFGQTDRDVPYKYEEAVKLAGHSCVATSGAWEIARKALEVLYADQIPVRGEIRVYAPGAEDEWVVGVFGEVITYITGAAPHTGFPGHSFAEADPVYNRQNLMIYADEPTGTPPPAMEWIFERMNRLADEVVKKVGVKFDLTMVQPPGTDPRNIGGFIIASGDATPEQAADYIKYWNERVEFVFQNADALEDFFTVTEYEVP